MNFVPSRLEDVGGATHIRLTDRIAFPLPPSRAARYQNVARNEKLLLGLRPEHITEAKAHPEPGIETFDAVLDVTEPMGMETLIYFTLEGAQICGLLHRERGRDLRPGQSQRRRARRRPASIGSRPQQYAPAKRGHRRRPLTAANKKSEGGWGQGNGDQQEENFHH